MTAIKILTVLICKFWLAQPCTELRNSSTLVYNTERSVFFFEGTAILPIVIDLEQPYTVCNVTHINTVLAGMIRSSTQRIQDDASLQALRSRKKREVTLLAGAAMVATAAWAGYEYVSTNAKIEQLRAELFKQQSYVRKVRMEDKQRYHEVFIAIRREMRQLSALATESTCLVEKHARMLIMENAMLQEYDDILIALKNERLSAKIIEPVQLNQLIKQSTILYDTLYVQSPYLMYIMAKMSFNLHEASADNASILRGALIIPLIKRQERVIVSITTKEENGSLKVFEPAVIAADSGMSVEACHREADFYMCTEAQLKPVKIRELTTDIYYEDGIFLLNTNKSALITRQQNGPKFNITGPASCSQADTNGVFYENRLLYVHSTAFHVPLKRYDFNLTPYDIELQFSDDGKLDDLSDQLDDIDDRIVTWHTAQLVFTLVVTATAVVALIKLYQKTKQHSKFVAQFQESGIPLSEILIVEESPTGTGRTRRVRKA